MKSEIQHKSYGYDSLKLNIPIAPGQQAEIASCAGLEHRCVTQYRNGSICYVSNLRNLKVRIREKSLTISGSFAKYTNDGANVTCLKPDELSKTLDSISEQLGVNLRWSTATRIDLALTARMTFPAVAYLELFLPASRYGLNRSQVHTIYIGNANGERTLVTYDKAAESFLSENLLRIEMRLKQRPSRMIGKDHSLFADDLLEPEVFADLQEAFRQFFEANILKRADHMNALNIRNLKDLEQYALERLIADNESRRFVLDAIEKQYRLKKIPAGNIDRLRKALRQTATDYQGSVLDELHEAVDAELVDCNTLLIELARSLAPVSLK